VLHEISVPYADTSAGALHWSPLPPETAPLDELVLGLGGARLVLHLLGASHAATLTTGGARTVQLVETVACPAHGALGEPLPAQRERLVDGLRYRFDSRVQRLGAEELRALAARLRRETAGRDDRLTGVFPGDRDALTALRGDAGPGGASWRTWHLYPGTGEAVRTTTRVRW
jgi:hypothetical protein